MYTFLDKKCQEEREYKSLQKSYISKTDKTL